MNCKRKWCSPSEWELESKGFAVLRMCQNVKMLVLVNKLQFILHYRKKALPPKCTAGSRHKWRQNGQW